MKTCTKCDNGTEFYREADSWCKDCYKEKAKAYYSVNTEKRRRYSKTYHHSEAGRTLSLAKYGITPLEYEVMLKRQDGKCAICESSEPGAKRKFFCVDHDHATGKVRGLLCKNCNVMLGDAKDSIPILRRAIKYLEEQCA